MLKIMDNILLCIFLHLLQMDTTNSTPIGVEPASNANMVEAPSVNQSEQPQNTNTGKNRRRQSPN